MADDKDTAIGFKTTRLADDIPADVLEQFIHRLLSSLDEYELKDKNKAYGNDRDTNAR